MQNATKKKPSKKPSPKSPRKADAADLAKHYPATIEWSDEDRCFVARVAMLPGCMSHGDTMTKAAANILDAAEGWVESALAAGEDLPTPPAAASGKFALRMPRSVHASVIQRAATEGVSVNQYIVSRLAAE